MDANFWITLLILAVIFLVAREFMCWYWKINQMAGSLEKIEEHLKKLAEKNSV